MEMTAQRVTTGIEGFDTLLGGGLLNGGLYFLLGPINCGKTFFAHQFGFHRVAKGENVVYCTIFSETHSRLITHVRQLSFFSLNQIGQQLFYISGFAQYQERGAMMLAETIQQTVRERRARLLVVDSLPLLVPGQPYDAQLNQFIHRLQVMSEMVGCTTLLLSSMYTGSLQTPGVLFADGAFEITQRFSENTVNRSIQVHKFRGSPYMEGQYPLAITGDGLSVNAQSFLL